jgi:hypothetical protein
MITLTILSFPNDAALVIGFIGVGIYVSEEHKEKTYEPTSCFVNSSSILETTCTSEIFCYLIDWRVSKVIHLYLILVNF